MFSIGQVTKGRYTVSFRNSDGLRLVGDLWPAGPDAVVLAHGFTSDRRSRGRFPRIARELAGSGYTALTFDFAGCGDSDDAVLTLEGQVADLRTAVRFLRERGYRVSALHGHSLGSLICLHCADERPATMVLTGAGPGAMHYDWSQLYDGERLKHLERTGILPAPVDVEHPSRDTVLVSGSLLDAFARVDQKRLLRQVSCPVLLMHGDDPTDGEEQQLLAHSRRALPLLPQGSRLHLLHGVGHSLLGRIKELAKAEVEWLKAIVGTKK